MADYWYLLGMIDPTAETPDSPRWIRWGALVIGPIAALLVYAWLGGSSLDHGGRAAVAVGVLMATWWITEAIPVEATSLLPMALFPLLGILGMKEACAPYADPVVFFFMGGMLIGAAMEKWGLPRRFALGVLSRVGGSPVMLVGGVVFASGIISMWVNNTSTAVMMLPITLSLCQFVTKHAGEDEAKGVRNFGVCLVLGVAYASSIGGMGTLFGSSPNVILTGQLRKSFGETLSFVEYARIGVPVMVVLLPLTWLTLVLMFPPRLRQIPGLRELVQSERQQIGPWTRGEITVLIVFVLAMAGWILLEPINAVANSWRNGGAALAAGKSAPPILTEAGVAVIAALSLFLIPVSIKRHEFALDWKTGGKIPWGILLLFGGGMALAEALRVHGVNEAIGQQFAAIGTVHPLIVLSVVVIVLIALTEVASNTAVATTFIPIAIAVAPAIGMNPFLLATAVSLAASSGFALPIGTPPNALAYATGRVGMGRFVRAGIVVDILAAIAITAVLYYGNGWLFQLPVIAK
jgi:sodium-dependent dicarboxylate transporter 2/3/5